jgi:uncharacterized protein (DUF3820 family)
MDDRLSFGKHNGREVWDLIEREPDYLFWCIENIKGFELDNEAFEALNKTVNLPTRKA